MDMCSQRDVAAPRTWCYVDTGPVIERIFAKYAGIGWIGKNTCILNEKLGSWLFLGVLLTSLELPPDLPSRRPLRIVHPLPRCLPHARVPRSVPDGRHEVHRISDNRAERHDPGRTAAGIGRQVFGCDICQDVCPWNRHAPAASLPEFQPRPAAGESRAGMAGATERRRIPRGLSRFAGKANQVERLAQECSDRNGE